MTETLLSYDVGDRPPRPQPPPSFEAQLKALPLTCALLLIRWQCEIWKGQSAMLPSFL
jgi:hypothetical protein